MEAGGWGKSRLGQVRAGILEGNVQHNGNCFHPSCSCSTLPGSLLLSFSLSSSSPSVLKLSCHSSPPSLLPSLPSTFLPRSREWLTPWSQCAAPSWGASAGTPSLNVSSSYRKSPPSWDPTPGSWGGAPEWIRGPRGQLQARGLGLQVREALEPGKPRLRAPQWEKVDTGLGVDLPPE